MYFKQFSVWATRRLLFDIIQVDSPEKHFLSLNVAALPVVPYCLLEI